jgi:hypothetical protein
MENKENKKWNWKYSVALFVLFCMAGTIFGQSVATLPYGYVGAYNYLAPTVTTNAGGVVTNSSGTTIVITGGSFVCNGTSEGIVPSQFVLRVNSTYAVVLNCATKSVYAELQVLGPGSAPGTFQNPTPTPNFQLVINPGEIPLAKVVCGASTCATITDLRTAGNISPGSNLGPHINSSVANGDAIFTVTLSGGTATKTFTTAYGSAPVCVGTDQTAAAAVKIAPTTTTAVVTGTTTDVISVACFGNPN